MFNNRLPLLIAFILCVTSTASANIYNAIEQAGLGPLIQNIYAGGMVLLPVFAVFFATKEAMAFAVHHDIKRMAIRLLVIALGVGAYFFLPTFMSAIYDPLPGGFYSRQRITL
jgi:hypothetical protein